MPLERIGHIAVEKRDAACPRCGGPSTETRVCYPSGKPASELWTGAVPCPVCVAKEEAEAARQRFAADVERLLAQLEVPKLYARATLDSFELHGSNDDRAHQARVLQLARRYLAGWPDDVPAIVVMTGGFGTGKGHISWAIAKALVETYLARVRVSVLSDVIRDLREAWGSRDDGGLSESQRLKRYREVDLLVIDEVSRHAFYGQPQQHLYDLVAWREIRQKPTILTTNEGGTDLADVLGLALASRVIGCNGVWQFGTSDWRRLNATRAINTAA